MLIHPAQFRSRFIPIGVMLIALGATTGPASVAVAAAPQRFPAGDPGQPTFLTVAGAAPLATDRTVAHWYSQFTDPTNGVTYGVNMVGADPRLARDVTIPVDLIPVDAVFPSQGNYALDGSDVIPRLLASPIFTASDFSSTPRVTAAADSAGNISVVAGGELSAGNTGVQFADAIMRSQFGKVGSSYHVRFQPTVLSPWTVNCSRGSGGVFQNPLGVVYGICDNFPFDPPWGQWHPDPTHLVIFVGDNIFIGSARGCCALGYHTASRSEGYGAGQTKAKGNQSVQTWSYATYLEPGTVNPRYGPLETDVTVFAHEIAEWADDPFVNNVLHYYASPLPPQGGCWSLLEVGDPVDRVAFTLPGNSYDTGPYADSYWHMQDIVFLPWFAREAPNATSQPTQTPSALSGRYTFMGNLNPYATFQQPAANC